MVVLLDRQDGGAQGVEELGFVVVQIDGIGTNWRSKAFHDVCWKNLGDAGFLDRIAWIEAAAAKGLTRFVGRRKELETLKETFERAKSGSGQVIGVVGEAGVGKSRLLLQLRGMLPEGEYSFLEGRCLHYGGSMPYLPILDVLKAYFDIEEEDREATIKKKVRERLKESNPRAEAVSPALHEVLSLKVEDEKYPQLGPQQRRERTFEAIRDVLIRESQRKPLILAVEDLHWIDKTSEEFLDYMIGWLPNTAIMLLLLYRPEYTHPWGSKSWQRQKEGYRKIPAFSGPWKTMNLFFARFITVI